jgi:hypothetical protein
MPCRQGEFISEIGLNFCQCVLSTEAATATGPSFGFRGGDEYAILSNITSPGWVDELSAFV